MAFLIANEMIKWIKWILLYEAVSAQCLKFQILRLTLKPLHVAKNQLHQSICF